MWFETQKLKWQKFSNLFDGEEVSLTPNSPNSCEWCHWHEDKTSVPEEWIKQTLSDFGSFFENKLIMSTKCWQ